MVEERAMLIGQLGMKFRKVGRMFQEEINEAFRSYMAWNEFEVLRTLHQKGAQTATELASELHVSPSHITAVGDMLVERAYIRRYRTNRDRRYVFMEITDEGKRISDLLEELQTNYAMQKYRNHNTEELVVLLNLLNRLFW